METLSSVQETEIEAIKAIFGHDYSSQTIMIPQPWKPPIKKIVHKLELKAREIYEDFDNNSASASSVGKGLGTMVYIHLEWSFDENYPNIEPKFTISNATGLGETNKEKLDLLIRKTAASLVGSEMLYEIANIVQDFITENNSIIPRNKASAHDVMEMNLEKRTKEAIKSENEKQSLEQLQRKEMDSKMAQKVRQEIEKMESIRKEEQIKRKKFPSEISSSTGSRDMAIVPKLVNAMICPFSIDGSQVAWFSGSEEQFLVDTFEVELQDNLDTLALIESQMEKAKKTTHSNCPFIYDHEAKIVDSKVQLRILIANRKYLRLHDMMRLGESISVSNAVSVISCILSMIEDFSLSDTPIVNLSQIWFDSKMIPFFAEFNYPAIIKETQPLLVNNPPHWKVPQNSYSHLGVLLLEMIGGDLSKYSSPLDCAAKLRKLNPELEDFITLVMDPNTKAFDLKSHSLFHSENQLQKSNVSLERSSNKIEVQKPLSQSPLRQEVRSTSRYYNDFEELEFLGRGGFGAVLKARNLVDGRFYAVKKIRLNPLDSEASKRLIREVQTLSRLQSDYIVRYYQAWFEEADPNDNMSPLTDDSLSYSGDCSSTVSSDDSLTDDDYDTDDWLSSNPKLQRVGSARITKARNENRSGATSPKNVYTQVLYIQMEYCEKKTLRDLIDLGLTLDQSWKYLRQALEGLNHLHQFGVIHRDLKPSNMFLDMNMRIKIGDFGLATAKKDASKNIALSSEYLLTSNADSLTNEIGTPVYIAPEIMSGSGRYNSKVDLYSLGIVFFEMIYRMPTMMERIQILKELRKPEINFPSDLDFKTLGDAATICKMLLDHVPRNRPSCEKVLQSNFLPANIEEEYVNEDLLRIVRQKNPLYFSRLITAIFGQVTDVHKDFAYDYNSNSVFDSSNCLVSSQMYLHAIRTFIKHAAVHISSPFILPKSEYTAEIYSSKKTAEFIDLNGNVIELPHDLTFPFARSLAQSTEEGITFPMKRFNIDKVFRRNVTGGQPRHIEEADYDIIYEKGIDDFIPETEVLKVVFEILEFGQIHRFLDVNDFHIRLNFSSVLSTLLIEVPLNLHLSVFEILGLLRKPLSLNQVKNGLSRLGLSKATIEKISSYDTVIPVSSKTSRESLQKFASKDVSEKLLVLASNLELMGVTCHVSFDPLLVHNPSIYSGLMFQVVRKNQNKYDVIAAGGRYEKLLEKIRSPFINRGHLNAVGVNIAISKFTSGIASSQRQLQEEDLKPLVNPCKQADIIVVCLGGLNSSLNSNRISIANDLWAAGLSVDISFHTTILNMEDLHSFRHTYSFAVILKSKGNDSYIIKVLNLNTKTETEAVRSAIVPTLQSLVNTGGKLKKDGSELDLLSPTIGSLQTLGTAKHEFNIIPVPTKKGYKKAKATEGVISSIAEKEVSVVFQKSSIFAVDLTYSDLLNLSSYWLGDEEMLKKQKPDSKEYLLLIKKHLAKAVSKDDSMKLLWVYSMIDQRSVPLFLGGGK